MPVVLIRPTEKSEFVIDISSTTRFGSKKKQIAYHAHLLEKDNGFSVELDHKQRGEELLCASITVSRDFPGVVEDKPNSIVMNVESKGELNEIARITVAIPHADTSIVKLVICSNGSVDWVNWQDSTNNDELLALIPDLTLKDLKNMHVPETRDRAFTILRSMLFFNKTVAEGE